MSLNAEPVLTGNFILELFDAWIFEFYNFAAFEADQVIMVFIVICRLVTGLTVSEMPLLGDATLGKQLESTVNGCVADARILPAQPQVELFGRKVRT